MSQKLDKQKENVNSLLKLIAENPELRIVPIVDSEVVCDDGHNWWSATWGSSEVDHLYTKNERLYLKNYDSEDLEEQYVEDMPEEEFKKLFEDEVYKVAEKYVDGLPWEKVITVKIEV